MKFIKPKRIAHANIQAEIYRQCKKNKIRCYLEYPFNRTERNGGQSPRADVVIINKRDEIVAIIEVKSYSKNRAKRPHNWKTPQIGRYRKLGLPIFITGRMEKIQELMDGLKQLLREHVYI